MMRDVRELYGREGLAGVLGLALVFYGSIQCEFWIVRYGIQALRALAP